MESDQNGRESPDEEGPAIPEDQADLGEGGGVYLGIPVQKDEVGRHSRLDRAEIEIPKPRRRLRCERSETEWKRNPGFFEKDVVGQWVILA
jgi:hypothetical protein